MKTIKLSLLFLFILGICTISNLSAQRYMENLDRGVFAQNRGDGSVYVNWRLFAKDAGNIGFNLYRSADGGTAVLLNSSVNTTTTDYVDNSANLSQSNAYYVKPVLNGIEQSASETFTLAANTAARQYLPINLQPISDGTYSVVHVYVGDVDGDGDYDYIVKRLLNSTTRTGTIKLDCYSDNGTFMWRVDLGPNIETTNSTMTSPVLVYDFNNDGKAEILAKTGESTTFGNGYTIGDTDGDGKTDYNTYVFGDYAHVFEGPEFISMINGETGAEMTRTNFIARGNTCDWGDCYGARVNFIMASVAYLDGVNPSAVFSRGPGEVMVVEAFDYTNGSLNKKWNWTSVGKSFASGTSWVDFHQIKCVDVDGDGKDEISWGSGMLNDNGSVLYTTELVHGDRFQIGDFNPNRNGLEVYAIQQNNPTLLGAALYDAATGTMLKKWYTTSLADIGRGDVGDIDPNTLGVELWSLANSNLQSCTGANISTSRPYPDLSIWWDGDLQREFFAGIGSGGYNPAISKYNSSTGATDRIFTIYNDGGSYAVTCPYGGRAPYIGDIFGDWREEIALETSDHSQLRIYTTKIPAQGRIYTMMQNPAYRIDVTTKGYLCSKLPDYYLGSGMSTPPTPNITLAGQTGSIALTATGSNGQIALNWSLSNISTGQELFRDTDSDPAGRIRIGVLSASVRSYTDASVTNGTTYYYWVKATDNLGNVINSNAASATPQGCTPTTITPYLQINGGTWSQSTTATVDAGSTIKFGPWPTSGGTWSWSGPNGYSASTREIVLTNVQTANAGNYIATYTNSSGCPGSLTFVVNVNSSITPITLTIQENVNGFCSVDGTVDNNNSGFTGTGFANTNNTTATGITWSVNIPSANKYSLVWRYANGGTTDRLGQLMVNGSSIVSAVSMPSTGSWTSWAETSSLTVSLPAGTILIRLQATTSAGLSNMDYMNITGISPTAVSCVGSKNAEEELSLSSSPFVIYPNPSNGEIIAINGELEQNSNLSVLIYDDLGKVQAKHNLGSFEKGPVNERISIQNLQSGMYIVKIYTDNTIESVAFIKQ